MTMIAGNKQQFNKKLSEKNASSEREEEESTKK